MFYLPPMMPGENHVHEWGFLSPVRSMSLESGVHTYDLPPDFGMPDGPITYENGANTIYPEISEVGEYLIRQKLQQNVATSRPSHFAVRVKDGAPTRYEILFWPIPDGAYSLRIPYRVTPDNDEVVLGGDEHFETVLSSCKACADELMGIPNSPHRALFMERVRRSIAFDRQLTAPGIDGLQRRQERSSLPSVWLPRPRRQPRSIRGV